MQKDVRPLLNATNPTGGLERASPLPLAFAYDLQSKTWNCLKNCDPSFNIVQQCLTPSPFPILI